MLCELWLYDHESSEATALENGRNESQAGKQKEGRRGRHRGAASGGEGRGAQGEANVGKSPLHSGAPH